MILMEKELSQSATESTAEVVTEDRISLKKEVKERKKPVRTKITNSVWAEIKIGYVKDGLKVKKLSEMYSIKMQTIRRKAYRDGWWKEKKSYDELMKSQGSIFPEEGNLMKEMQEKLGNTKSVMGGSLDKSGAIDRMIMIANGVLAKLQLRVVTIKSSDDKEMKWLVDATARMYDILEKLLGIKDGEGNLKTVEKGVVQVDVLMGGLDMIDDFNAKKDAEKPKS